ncbi:MAG: prepilin-type N-terminal cleavage/methylation domain-containing protein [Gemmatimonadaceae bacterium]
MSTQPVVRPSRRGFTLVELLVALLLFDCALLAFAGNAALLVRAQGVARRREAGIAAALSTLASFRSRGCPAPVVGQASPAPGVREFWSVRSSPDSVRMFRDSVDYQGLAHRSAFVITSAVVC